MTSLLDSFLKKISDRSAVVGVIGQGYVGLPLSLVFVEAGLRVLGLDRVVRESPSTRSSS